MQRLISFLSLTLPLAASCKPSGDAGSRILESGGTAVEWRLKSTLASTGDLTLEKTGTGATADAATITEVQYEVSTAPDSTTALSTIDSKKWIPLTVVAGAEVKFNVLLTTKGLGLCYTNAVSLNGSNDAVLCKDAPAAVDPVKTKLVQDLKEACKKLATTAIDAAKPKEFYASFDEKLNAEKCTCLNGKARDIFYEAYMVVKSTAAEKFDEDCKKALASTDTSTGTSTATTYAEYAKQSGSTATPTDKATATTTDKATATTTDKATATTTDKATATTTDKATGTSTDKKSDEDLPEGF